MLWRNTGGGGGDGTGGVEEGMAVALCAVGFAEREGVTYNMSKLYICIRISMCNSVHMKLSVSVMSPPTQI